MPGFAAFLQLFRSGQASQKVNLCDSHYHTQQVDKVIWHKAASPCVRIVQRFAASKRVTSFFVYATQVNRAVYCFTLLFSYKCKCVSPTNYSTLKRASAFCQYVYHLVLHDHRCCRSHYYIAFQFQWAGNLGGSGPHLIHSSLGPPKPTTQMAIRSVSCFCRAHWFCQSCYMHPKHGPHLSVT